MRGQMKQLSEMTRKELEKLDRASLDKLFGSQTDPRVFDVDVCPIDCDECYYNGDRELMIEFLDMLRLELQQDKAPK